MSDVAKSQPTSSKRILLVDDFQPWRDWVRSRLTLHSRFELCEAVDGSEAVRKARELEPDLILLDIGLPDMNGIKAAERIRQSAPTAKIIFLTQENDAEIRSAALATGAAGYVVKAKAASQLVAAIQAASQVGPTRSERATTELTRAYSIPFGDRPSPAKTLGSGDLWLESD